MEVFIHPKIIFIIFILVPQEKFRRIWKDSIKESFNYKCAYCGSRESLTLDHVVPRFHGGTDETKNLICACAECNRDKSHEDWRSWYTRQGFYDPYKEARIIEWQKQNTANFSNYIETKRAGMILTRNNFVYKKLKKS